MPSSKGAMVAVELTLQWTVRDVTVFSPSDALTGSQGESCSPHDFRSNLIQRKDLVGETGPRDKSWHSPYHAAGFILHKDTRTNLVKRFATANAILPHAGENDA